MVQKKTIYLDHAAATPLDPRVFSVMRPFLVAEYGNASALYASGVRARKAVEKARRQMADALGTNPDTIVFTGGGTEANNLAIVGLIKAVILSRSHDKIPHIITTQIEHSSILEPLRHLEKEGIVRVTYLPVSKEGLVSVDDVKKALRKETMLISIGYANNEIGTIQPIHEIGKMLLQWRRQNTPSPTRRGAGRGLGDRRNSYPLFHTDACQAVNYCDTHVDFLHVDLMTINASKIYGPKGVGALYVRRGVQLAPIMHGGGQESGLRSGTENVAGIVGFGEAIEVTTVIKEKEIKRLQKLQEEFWKLLCEKIKEVSLNAIVIARSGTTKQSFLDRHVIQPFQKGWIPCDDRRLPNNLNIHIPGVEAETLMLYLNAAGIECSAGSACSSDSSEASHVLRAIGLSEKEARECLRFTMGRSTTKVDIIRTVQEIQKALIFFKKGQRYL